MKKIFCMIIFLLIPGIAWCQAENGRPYLDRLYSAEGQLPINTLVVDAEIYGPTDEKGSSSLTIWSRDKIVFKKPNKIKVTSVTVAPGDAMDGMPATIISDGQNSWMYISQGQYPVKKQQDPQRPTLNLPPNLQTYPRDAGNPCIVVGDENIKEINTKAVRIIDESRSIETTVWIDTKRWVPVQLEEKSPSKDGEGHNIIQCRYRDFRKLKDGRWLPFVIEIHKNEQVANMVVFKAVSVNQNIPDHIFEPMQQFVK